ncbi:MAG TPA: SIR2 family protein [Coleofasciculaceae cyanobacterium]
MLLPDQHHIEQIRQRLWCGREFGQAAVMVGAGFSCNADQTSATSPDFPLWWDLEEKMRSELPLGVVSANLDALELASEYEKAHGRQKLEQFLVESIPDKKYNPGKLHELLLSLPWSDVFTTNYDTLLERTFILERKYDVIYNPADIPGRMKPRIVKLHGSFESYRPFIFTQQDYESYPRKFAPFVNIVQQSIMENAFCLIGFSGEDPNFLKWIEWVRNNLNEYSPPIYLCGLLNISSYQKQILKSRKVTTIDLSPLFPKSEWQDRSLRHSKALEWFFLNLMYGEPPDLTDWLSKHNQTRNQRKWKPSKSLPAIPSPSESLSNAENEVDQLKIKVDYKVFDGNFSNQNNIQLEQDLSKLIALWSEQRQEYIKYKGWVILPRKYRNRLWNSTNEWTSLIFDFLAQLSPPNNLLLLFELNWRLEKTLTPLIFNEWIKKIVSVVEQFNPYPNLLDLNKAHITPNKKEYQQQGWQWENIQQAWVELAFALLRAGRDNHEQELFDLWLSRLENIVGQNSEWQSRWYYEQCLFYIYRLDQDLVLSIVEAWESTTIPDFWQIKRASIVAQTGNLHEAQRIAKETLNKIRSCIQPDIVNYYLLSQEGWAMRLLKEIEEQIKWDKRKFDDNSNEIFLERWEQLEKYHCNPNSELEILEQEVTKPIPQAQAHKENKRSFLPGRTTRTFRFSTKTLYPEFHPAFESLRILEEGGLPLSLINIQWHSKHITNATKWTISFFPTWSFLALIQVSKSDLVKEWLSFIDIAILPQEEINYLYEILFGFLSKVVYQLTNLRINSSYKNEYLDSKLAIFTETLSYLSIRLDSDKINAWFDQHKDSINRLYQSKNDLLYDDLAKAIEKIIACLSLVILPNLKDAEDKVKQLALNLINEFEKINISVLFVLPMTLFIDNSSVLNDIAKKLRFSLLSLNSEEVDNAIIGLQYWLICSQQRQIPEPPPELLNDLTNKLAISTFKTQYFVII